MTLGVGCDIIKIERIGKAIETWGEKFLKRIFTLHEIEKACDKGINITNYFAKRFCAKEAISKALKSGIGNEFSFKDCEILNHKSGEPYINFLKASMQSMKAHLSLSDESDFALAFVVIEHR